MNILFVCSGNTCRSPMAELYCRECIKKFHGNISVSSAGLCTCGGMPISTAAAIVLEENGIESSGFFSSQVSVGQLLEADLIIVMTQNHKNAISRLCPEATPRTHLLLEFSGGGDVYDPFGSDVATYRATFNQMKKAIDNLLEKYKNENL